MHSTVRTTYCKYRRTYANTPYKDTRSNILQEMKWRGCQWWHLCLFASRLTGAPGVLALCEPEVRSPSSFYQNISGVAWHAWGSLLVVYVRIPYATHWRSKKPERGEDKDKHSSRNTEYGVDGCYFGKYRRVSRGDSDPAIAVSLKIINTGICRPIAFSGTCGANENLEAAKALNPEIFPRRPYGGLEDCFALF